MFSHQLFIEIRLKICVFSLRSQQRPWESIIQSICDANKPSQTLVDLQSRSCFYPLAKECQIDMTIDEMLIADPQPHNCLMLFTINGSSGFIRPIHSTPSCSLLQPQILKDNIHAIAPWCNRLMRQKLPVTIITTRNWLPIRLCAWDLAWHTFVHDLPQNQLSSGHLSILGKPLS